MRRGVRWTQGILIVALLVVAVITLTLALNPVEALAIGAVSWMQNYRNGSILAQTGASSTSKLSGIAASTSPYEALASPSEDRPYASTGCGRPAPFALGSSQNESISSGGLLRMYRLHIPRGYQSQREYPLLLSLHGNASSAQQQEQRTGFSQLADRGGFIVVYPQGTPGPNGRLGWSSGGPGHPTLDDTRFIADVLDAVQTRLCVDPYRIYASGFSNGGGMTWVLSCQMAGRIAAFASVSGSYYATNPPCAPTRAVPVLEIHGTGDATVPYNGRAATGLMPVSDWLASWAKRDGCAAQPTIRALSHKATLMRWSGCHSNVILVHIRITSGHHVWPSGATSAIPGGASATIWSFLSAYTLPKNGTLVQPR
jgi:polyhydroxybutyrate depolymerase